jgi:hypothetical protein
MIGLSSMNTESIVGMLIAQREKLNRAIAALGGEGNGGTAPAKRRGRPPKNPLAAVVAPASVPAAPAKKKYWAAKKVATKKAAKS